jgi:hypothetical protein
MKKLKSITSDLSPGVYLITLVDEVGDTGSQKFTKL